MTKILMTVVIVLALSTGAYAGCSVSMSSPGGYVRGPFNVTGSVTCSGGVGPVKFLPNISGAANLTAWCYGTDGTCSYDYAAGNHGILMELPAGNHTFELQVLGSDQVIYSSGVQNVMVDNTPTIQLSSPSGTIRGPYDITGSATFAPTQSATKGEIRIFYNNTDYFNSPAKSITCASESCSFNFPSNINAVHGNFTVIAVAIGGGTTTQVSNVVFNDRTPTITSYGPIGTVSSSELVAHATFVPGVAAYNGFTGSIGIGLDGRGIGSVSCYNYECDLVWPIYNLSAGAHTVYYEAAPYWTAPRVNTPLQTFYIEDYKKTDFPRDCKASVCGESEFNTISGNINHDQELFSTSGGPLATAFSMYYDSMDQINIFPSLGGQKPYKIPYGQGWTSSYDIALYTNPTTREKVLRGGGLAKRFYAPSGTSFVSQPGDSSVLVKNTNGTYTITHRDGLKYNFDANGLLQSVIDRFGNAVTLDRTVAKTLKITDPEGRQTVLGYDGYGERVVSITDPEGKVFNLTYDTNGLLTSIAYPEAVVGAGRPTWSYTYNSSFMMTSKTDPVGQKVKYDYDLQRRVSKSTDPEGLANPSGHTKSIVYGNGTTAFTEKDGGVWTYAVDTVNGLINSKTDPKGGVTSYTYNSAGYAATETTSTDAGSYVRSYIYDAYGNITDLQGYAVVGGVAQSPDVHQGYTYANANYDQLTSVTDYLANLTTTLAYDQDGVFLRTRITSPSGAVTTIRQNGNGTINDVSYPDGRSLAYVYTAGKLLQSVTDNSGVKTEFSSFNGKGLPQTVKVYDGAGGVRATTSITYDTFGRVLTSTLQAGSSYVSTFGYDAAGNVVSATDANGNTTGRAYNYKGLPRQVTDALGKLTTLEYVSAENLSALTDANGNRTAFAYDTRGLLAKETPPVGVPIRYEYNASGLVKQKVNDSTGQVLITYNYDPQRRLTGRNYLDGTADSFTYDGAGRLATASNQNISYNFAYDAYGRLQSQTDNQGNVVAYGYDAAGRRTSLTVNNAHTVAYGYTAEKLTSITSNLAGAFGLGYDNLGRRSSLSYPNGITGTYSYNSDQPGWLAGISYTGTLPIYSVTYPNFDKVGNRTAKNEGSLVTFGYDSVYRLLSSTAGEVFTYDAAGNRLTDAARIYTVAAGNVMAAAGTTVFTYDNYGNTQTAGPWGYIWNSAGQLVGAANGGTVASYAYDPFGRRISKMVNGNSTTFIYDGQDIAASISNGAVTYFIHGPGVDEHLALFQGTPYFYHTDGLGSVTRITDVSQSIVQSYSYTSFGTPTPATGFQQPYIYTAREYDGETGLYYYRARYYDPIDGRFISRDPIGLAGGINQYAYVSNDPVNATDPSGLDAITDRLKEIDTAGLEAPNPFLDPVNYVGGIGSGVWKWVNRPYWRYIGPNSNPASKWMTRSCSWKPPYGNNFDKAKDALQMPFKPTGVVKVDVPWYKIVRGPRAANLHPEWGKGGGLEYYRGWRWPE